MGIMDTISVVTDAGTRPARGGRRGRYVTRSVEEKRRIVEESLVGGASVAKVARRNDMNANQLFGWRRQYAEGRFGPVSVASPPKLLAVRIEEPIECQAHPSPTVVPALEAGWIEIECCGGYRVRVHGPVDRSALQMVLEIVAGR